MSSVINDEKLIPGEKMVSKEDGCKEIAMMQNQIDNHERRITKHGEEIDELKIREATMSVTLNRIEQTVGKIDAKLDINEQKPARRWDALVTQIMSLMVAAISALVLAKIGLGY